jgi:hypothetical protein
MAVRQLAVKPLSFRRRAANGKPEGLDAIATVQFTPLRFWDLILQQPRLVAICGRGEPLIIKRENSVRAKSRAESAMQPANCRIRHLEQPSVLGQRPDIAPRDALCSLRRLLHHHPLRRRLQMRRIRSSSAWTPTKSRGR